MISEKPLWHSRDADLSTMDTEIHGHIVQEQIRQEQHLELIASENYASHAVMQAQASVLTNKYAEGYPGRRYYGGCAHVDAVETIAIERLKALYQADFANVQPHSGSQANAAVYLALLSPGDRILGMGLSDGGHLTHGAKVNFSGALYDCHSYGLHPDSGLIDYDAVRDRALSLRPKLIIAGFSAYSRIIDWRIFRDIADEVGAYLLVDMAHVSGLVAAGLYPNPVPHADVVTSTTHKTLRGPRGGFIIARDNPELTKRLNSAVFPGSQGGPMMHTIAAKAVAFKEASAPTFKHYQQAVLDNAKAMASVLLERGRRIVSSGTDNHLLLLDLIGESYSGKAAEQLLADVNITLNFNSVPNDPRSPWITSGLRLGTPAMTTRGLTQADARIVAHCIADVLDYHDDPTRLHAIKAQVAALCQRYPVYHQRSDD